MPLPQRLARQKLRITFCPIPYVHVRAVPSLFPENRVSPHCGLVYEE